MNTFTKLPVDCKRHEILKAIIDNNMLCESMAGRYKDNTKYYYVCEAIKAVADYNSRAANDLLLLIIEGLATRNTNNITNWLRHNSGHTYTAPEIFEYRKLWVQAMYEACLKEDI